MKQTLADFVGLSCALMGDSPYSTQYGFTKRKSNKYNNKNTNVIYYIDDKGNIRRKKIRANK